MSRASQEARKRLQTLAAGIDAFSRGIALYILPCVLLIITALAFVVWPRVNVVKDSPVVPVQVFKATSIDLSPERAREVLDTAPRANGLETKRAEAPFWYRFSVPAGTDEHANVVVFPSKHTIEIACWDATTLALLGYGDRHKTAGDIQYARSGFALSLPRTASKLHIMCRSTFVGPARLSVELSSQSDLEVKERVTAHHSGMITGGLVLLAIFMLLTAFVTRQKTYVHFGMWLFLNARMALMTIGADTYWLEHAIPTDYLLRMRLITTGLFVLTSVELFIALFYEELTLLRVERYADALRVPTIALLLLSCLLAYSDYLPFLWIVSLCMVGFMLYLIVRMIIEIRSRTACWYGAAIAVALLSGSAEIMGASMGWRWMSENINFVTSALFSSVLASLSVVEQFRREQSNRIAVQARLEENYRAIPIGLFTLSLDGRILSGNPAFLHCIGSQTLGPSEAYWEAHFEQGSFVKLLELVRNDPQGELLIDGLPAGRLNAKPRRFTVKASLTHDKLEGFLQDVTEKELALHNLQYMASHDPSTGFLNLPASKKVYDSATMELVDGKPAAIAYLELGRLRNVNDQYGHTVIDEVLRQIGDTITTALGGPTHIIRCGYDQLLLILPDTTIDIAQKACETLNKTLSNAIYHVNNSAFSFGLTIGLLEIRTVLSWEEAVNLAEAACRTARSQGKSLVVYEANAVELRERRLQQQIIADLSRGRVPEWLHIEVQPIISTTKPYSALNCEVLLCRRLEDGEDGSVAPLLEIAERNGLTRVIDEWVLNSTVAWIEENIDSLSLTDFVSIDIHGRSLRDDHFITTVRNCFNQHPQAARLLCLDVPASAVTDDFAVTKRFIDAMVSMHIRVALDRLSAASLPLQHFAKVPIAALKIDSSFMQDVGVVEALVVLADHRGMVTIAENVADPFTAEAFVDAGVRYLQGMGVAKALPKEHFINATSMADFIHNPDIKALMDEQNDKVDATLGSLDLSRFN